MISDAAVAEKIHNLIIAYRHALNGGIPFSKWDDLPTGNQYEKTALVARGRKRLESGESVFEIARMYHSELSLLFETRGDWTYGEELSIHHRTSPILTTWEKLDNVHKTEMFIFASFITKLCGPSK